MRRPASILLITLLAASLWAGCSTPPRANDTLPPGAEAVAGGISIRWIAPRPGTALFVEASSGRIVRSQSLAAGEEFIFNPIEDDDATLLNRLFGHKADPAQGPGLMPVPPNARFVLYFAPTPPIETRP